MYTPDPDCVKTLELHGSLCIDSQDWTAVREKIEREFVGTYCSGCYLTLRINKHGNLELACVNADVPGGQVCCLNITYMEGRGHRAACACRPETV